MRRWFGLLLLCFLPVLAVAGASGKAAPEFSLPDQAGKQVALSSLRGEVVLLDFWATYCKPCKVELPILDRMQAKYKKKGLKVVSVAVDEDPQDAKDFLAQHPVALMTLFDAKDEVRPTLALETLPAILLVDRKGKIRYVHKGALAEDDPAFLKEVETLLREKK